MGLSILGVIDSQALAHHALSGLLGQAAAPGGGLGGMIPMLLVMFAVFYFLLIRPQQKQAKEHKAMLASLKKGDAVVTNGGIIARVHAVGTKFVVLEAGRDVRFRVLPGSISAKAPEGMLEEAEPKAEEPKAEAKNEK